MLKNACISFVLILSSQRRKKDKGKGAVFPCLIKIVDSNAIFNTKEPIVIGVNVLAGVLRVGTPLCVPDKDVPKKLTFF